MVFQHVPYEPLGTLDPLIRCKRHRIRYVNFGRNPLFKPNIQGYDGLIILGGPMNVGDDENFPHLQTEQDVIRQAMQMDIPILGICLGAQLIAAANGAAVYPAVESEIGWSSVSPTVQGLRDPLIKNFRNCETIFQWHSFTFDIPKNAEHLLQGESCTNQAFCIKQKVYGLQFHLEINRELIDRWLNLKLYQSELGETAEQVSNKKEQIFSMTESSISRSISLSEMVFNQFIDLIPATNGHGIFPHR